jgi:hypothetical protein
MGAAALERFEQKRIEGTMTAEDFDDEYLILITELWALEEDILINPGPLAPNLVPVRRARKKAK